MFDSKKRNITYFSAEIRPYCLVVLNGTRIYCYYYIRKLDSIPVCASNLLHTFWVYLSSKLLKHTTPRIGQI